MQQTASATGTTATAPTNKSAATSGAEHATNTVGTVSVTSSAAPVKLEQLNAASAATPTTSQVITVVAPSNVTQAHGQPVVVQVSTGGQFIAVAVSPDPTGQTSNSQASDAGTNAGTPGTTSTEDEDGQGTGSGFEDFTAAAAYTNGNSNPGAMTYYTTDSYTTTTAYYNSSVTYSQGVNQILTDGTYLVMEQTDPSALAGAGNAAAPQRTSPQTESKPQLQQHPAQESVTITTNPSTTSAAAAAAALLINPFAIHSSSDHSSAHSVTGAVSNPTTAIIANPGASVVGVSSNTSGPASTPSGQNSASLHHHQNVRDMDIVHVQWLIENYETAEGVSLPRSTLYSHYQTHCSQQTIEPVNAASFGKLIRSVFIGLRTRRLGTRGNSKYHYYGIRVKPGSPLSRIMDTSGNSSANASDSSPTPPKRTKTSSTAGPVAVSSGPKTAPATPVTSENHQATLTATSPEVLQTYLGDPKAILPSVWPDEPTVPSNDTDSPGVLATKFAACYRKHYEEIINVLGNLQFNQVEQIWLRFWQPENKERKEEKSKPTLTLKQLHDLTTTIPPTEEGAVSSLAEWIIQTDYTLYNALISSLLLPNLLKPIPQQLTQQIRNFAKNITGWMTNALAGYDETFVALKVGAVGAFSHTLRRYTSLNHLSSAARAVLQNQQQIQQMINDLNRVDFKNVQEQASWVCQCDDDVVEQIEHSFKGLLQQENPFDRWGVWCEQILDSCLQDNDVRSATQFFFKWGFYSSLVMRDLTLRSASSFGSFHLIRLLFDEYIFYLIEHRVAKATAKTPLQVLGEARSLRNQNSLGATAGAEGPGSQ